MRSCFSTKVRKYGWCVLYGGNQHNIIKIEEKLENNLKKRSNWDYYSYSTLQETEEFILDEDSERLVNDWRRVEREKAS